MSQPSQNMTDMSDTSLEIFQRSLEILNCSDEMSYYQRMGNDVMVSDLSDSIANQREVINELLTLSEKK